MQRNFRSSGAWLVMLACVVVGASSAHAENYAFLVAVQDYDVKDLKKLNFTRSDIEELAKTLQKSGFKPENIVVLNDKPENSRYMAEAGKIRSQLDLLLATLESKDTLIVAFSGHGVQFEGEEKNYYCPLDTNLDDPKRANLIPLSEIYEKLKQCPAERKLLLVDACRNDPLSPVKKSRATVTLKSVTRPQTEAVPKGVVALFSCSAGQESYEWPELKHGVFFHHVLEGWNGAAADEAHQITLDGLVAYSRRKTQGFARLNLNALQTPQLKSDFEGTWVLRKLSSGNEKEITSNGTGMKLVLIPAGKFLMGSPNNEQGAFPDEKPRHPVQITKAFYMGKYEVTRGEFRKFFDATKYETDCEKDGYGGSGFTENGGLTLLQKPVYTWRAAGFPQTDDNPVINVSWNDAVAFCKWLSEKDGATYRLPTEAEWEYACKAGTNTRWYGGDDESALERIANVADASWVAKFASATWSKSWDDGYPFSAPVGKFRPNQFGLYDMHGNVFEWCQDWFDSKYYTDEVGVDPQGPSGSQKDRVLRGGSWLGRTELTRSAYRLSFPPTTRNVIVGFRVVRVL